MSQNQNALEFGPYRIDAGQKLLYLGQQEVPLPPKVFETLLVLVENQGRILEKDELMTKVWPDSFVEEGSLARNVSILRKVLGQGADDQQFIQTIPKRGYRLVAIPPPLPPGDGNGIGSAAQPDVQVPAVQIIEEHSRVEAAFDVEIEEQSPIVELAKTPATNPLPVEFPAVITRPVLRRSIAAWSAAGALLAALAVALGWI